MYAKWRTKLGCSNCQGWGHTKKQCRECFNCDRQKYPSHLCWEKKKKERRGVSAAKLIEVEIGSLDPLKLLVEILRFGKEDESSVNQVENQERERNYLLHIKS